MAQFQQFTSTFNRLFPMGIHMAATYVDHTGLLQVSEISGGYTGSSDDEDIFLQIFVSSKNAPSFFERIKPQLRMAVVICSPLSMETHQVKGWIESIRDLQTDEYPIFQSWQENYFESIKSIGIPESVLREVQYEPTHSVRIRISDIFLQTPAPGTGEKW